MTAILAFLKVTAYGNGGEAAMNQAVLDAASTKEDLADVINVAIEELIRQRFELPGFTIMMRAARKARFTVNAGYHKLIYQELGKDGRKKIDALFAKGSSSIKSPWDKVKQEPQRPTVGHMREFAEHLR